jgi:hypothetical protein
MSDRVKGILPRCLAICLLIGVCGCSGGKSIENKLSPDPSLVAAKSTQPNTSLPADFPTYPQAQLKSTEQTKERGMVTSWTTPDPIDFIYTFYQKELVAKQWEIVSQPTDTEPRLVAKKAETNVSIELSTAQQQTGVTAFNISLLVGVASALRNLAPPSSSVVGSPSPTPTPTPIASPSSQPPESATSTTPDYLADLTQIGVFTSAEAKLSRTVTRREYVRWLMAAYNRINSSKPTQQIKLATTDIKPAFQDVPATHPDFPSIQGLAEAGLIPSTLSGDATSLLFRPDAPLTREQLILWKVPLDTRAPLPKASLDAIGQTWGFQDAGKVEPQAIRALLADFQNGDRSNVRRVFGYTTLFQPKKTVNLGEVAANIWYFGANSEGLSARDAISTN